MSQSSSHLVTHLDAQGRLRMVDVSDKNVTSRTAIAEGIVRMSQTAFEVLRDGRAGKGAVLAAAEMAAIGGCKRTAELIPLCHPLSLTKVQALLTLDARLPGVRVQVTTKTCAQTGVEMEALTGVSVACLTVYDMLKAVDKGMTIEGLGLCEKTGGKSGDWRRAGRALS